MSNTAWQSAAPVDTDDDLNQVTAWLRSEAVLDNPLVAFTREARITEGLAEAIDNLRVQGVGTSHTVRALAAFVRKQEVIVYRVQVANKPDLVVLDQADADIAYDKVRRDWVPGGVTTETVTYGRYLGLRDVDRLRALRPASAAPVREIRGRRRP